MEEKVFLIVDGRNNFLGGNDRGENAWPESIKRDEWSRRRARLLLLLIIIVPFYFWSLLRKT
jgi:hypothetical protein